MADQREARYGIMDELAKLESPSNRHLRCGLQQQNHTNTDEMKLSALRHLRRDK